MKKIIHGKLPFWIPVILITLFFVVNQFSCQKEDRARSSLFGNMQQSPLKNNSDTGKACELQDVFVKIFDLYRDSVVFITTEQYVRVRPHPFFDDPIMRDFFGGSQRSRVQKRTGLGTGFILTEDGYVCTNHHVVASVDKVTVSINKKEYSAKIIGSDERTDIALLKIDSRDTFKPVFMGDSDSVRVGDWAIAIGNPFGLDRTFTVGVVSAIGRKDVDYIGGSHIQTDASINPGNSGGPLINIYGEVIGINRMIYSQSGGYMGIGFAIPVNTARSVLEQLKKHKKVRRGYVGVSIAKMTEQYAKELGLDSPKGAFVGDVIRGGPADKGGLRVGDVILKVDSDEISGFKDLLNSIGRAPIGKTLKFTVWRNRKKITLFVRVAERP